MNPEIANEALGFFVPCVDAPEQEKSGAENELSVCQLSAVS
jgi:hypothetical protein